MQLHDWLSLPQQFADKPLYLALMQTLKETFDEILQVFQDIDAVRDIDTATGQNLDYLGTKVNLSRKDAYDIIMKATNTEINDDLYRKVIKFQALQNSCECTYDDIMQGIEYLWNTEVVTYAEEEETPATIFIDLPTAGLEGTDPAIGRVLCMRPSGVNVIYRVEYGDSVNITGIERIEYAGMPIGMEMPYWYNVLMMDGTWSLDGTHLLDATWGAMPSGMIINEGEVATLDTFEDYMVIRKANYWTLDGSESLDGEKLLNAYLRTEVV